jgi:hypothetical protein
MRDRRAGPTIALTGKAGSVPQPAGLAPQEAATAEALSWR